MTSKAKPAAQERAAHVRNADKTKPFTKDWERLSRSGRYDMNRLKAVMTLLIANDGPLPPEYKDHPLEGRSTEHRECHVGGDFLLICATAFVFAMKIALPERRHLRAGC